MPPAVIEKPELISFTASPVMWYSVFTACCYGALVSGAPAPIKNMLLNFALALAADLKRAGMLSDAEVDWLHAAAEGQRLQGGMN